MIEKKLEEVEKRKLQKSPEVPISTIPGTARSPLGTTGTLSLADLKELQTGTDFMKGVTPQKIINEE